MISSEWARRDEYVGVGFTSIDVTSKKIRMFKTQGLICKNTSTNRSLAVLNRTRLSQNTSSIRETASAGALPLIHAGADQVKGQRRGRAPGSLAGGVAGLLDWSTPTWPWLLLLLLGRSTGRGRSCPDGDCRQLRPPQTMADLPTCLGERGASHGGLRRRRRALEREQQGSRRRGLRSPVGKGLRRGKLAGGELGRFFGVWRIHP